MTDPGCFPQTGSKETGDDAHARSNTLKFKFEDERDGLKSPNTRNRDKLQ